MRESLGKNSAVHLLTEVSPNGAVSQSPASVARHELPWVTVPPRFFEDAIQHCAAKAESGSSAIVTRNKDDYSTSEILVLSPDEFLARRELTVE